MYSSRTGSGEAPAAALGFFLLNTAQAVFLCAWSVLWISLAVIVSIFHGELPLVMARRCWAPGLVWASTADLRVEAMPRLDSDRSYVFVMNHQSMLDIAVAFAVIPKNLRFVAKAILRFVPFLGLYMWRTGMIFVERKSPKKAYESLASGARRMRRGISILAYPEGTRSTDGCIKPFKRGSFVLAQVAEIPIVPVAIEGSWRVLPRGGFRLRPGVVRVKIGEPIPTTGLAPHDVARLAETVRARLIELHRSIGGLGEGAEGEEALRLESDPDRGVSARGAHAPELGARRDARPAS
jgi:1-acyl-sn-glycerol-3-phosphate acyltransferase